MKRKRGQNEALPPPPPRTALELLRDQTHVARVSTGCKPVDDCLGGGLLGHGITELCGESSAGKTQICLQTLLHAQLPTKARPSWGSVLYLCTEGEPPMARLREIARHVRVAEGVAVPGSTTAVSSLGSSSASAPTPTPASTSASAAALEDAFLKHTFIEKASDVDELWTAVSVRIPRLLESRGKGGVRLVVLDSLAAVLRGEYGNDKEDTMERSRLMLAIATTVSVGWGRGVRWGSGGGGEGSQICP